MRGAFTAGITATLIEEGIDFPHVSEMCIRDRDGTIAPGGSGSEDAGTMPILGQPNYSTVAHSSVDQIDDATVMVSLGSLDGKNIKLCAAEGSCMTLKAKYDKNAKAPYEMCIRDRYGMYNQNLQAVPPTGSISYINGSTSSIHPIVSRIEIRKEGKIGRVYYPAPYMTNENLEYYQDAYEIGPEKIIDTYAVATQHVDQGLSLTLFYPCLLYTSR